MMSEEPDFEDMVARAEAAILALRDAYKEQLAQDVAELHALEEAYSQGALDLTGYIEKAHAIAHNIKGQGGSFGYDLVTSVGDSFCIVLRGPLASSSRVVEIVSHHICVLNIISGEDIVGDGASRGEAFMAELRQLTGL